MGDEKGREGKGWTYRGSLISVGSHGNVLVDGGCDGISYGVVST